MSEIKLIEMQEILAEEKGVFVGVQYPLWLRALERAINIIEKYRETLEFYGAETHYEWDYDEDGGAYMPEIQKDGGEKAREKLKLTEE